MQIAELSYKSSQYPDLLREIAYPPKQLFTLGELSKQPCVAIVGSRKPTDYGKQITYRLASELASAGVVIVSGLAIGIDGIAHQAAVEAGGKTIAVLACGLDRIYPSSHRQLAIRILKNGTLMTEYPQETTPFKSNFVARNRIISGLSLAVIITEADASSGSLITANFALQQNRLVMAVPGNITSFKSAGPNNLTKTGAIPVTDTADVLAALDLESTSLRQPITAKSKEEALILDLLSSGVNTSQELIGQSKLSAGQFANVITLMEITGKVRNLGAGNWIAR